MSQKKQIFKLSILKQFLNDSNSCVSLVPSTRLLALPPFFLNDMKSGIFYLLNSILKKYDRSLDGILIGYQNVKILMDENTGMIPIGSAETEVNVSVEFYIFQPKIGNTLEGIINKKSNNHIGCLVHRYFNATILKPEDVEYEDWNCKDFDVNDKILFEVKDLDFTGSLPYIEGIVSEDLVDCAKPTKHKRKDNCDLIINKDSQSKILSGVEGLMDNSLESETHKKPNEDAETLDNNVHKLLDSVLNEKEVKRKKKKKITSKEKNDTEEEKFQGQSLMSTEKEVIVSSTNLDSKREKKEKRKKEKDPRDERTLDISKKKEDKNIPPEFIIQEYLHADSYFVKKPVQSTKEKKRKEEESNWSRNKRSEGLTQHDELFYSTQLEPHSESKMNTSCSPIPKVGSDADKEKLVVGKEKRKERKRKAEDLSDARGGKRVKTEESQINGSADFVDELLQRELNKAKEELNMPEAKKREKEKSLYEKLVTEAKSEMGQKKNKEGDSGSSKKKKLKKKQKEGKFKNGSMYDVEMTPEKWSVDKSLFSDSEQSHQSHRSRAKGKDVNGVSSCKKLIQSMLDQFFLEGGKKRRNESDRESLKEKERKEERGGGEEERVGGEKEESLYEKLLREARSRIEVMENSPSPKNKRKTK